jgi:hypothetical protein
MLSVEVKTKGEDGNVTRDTHHVNLEQAYRTRTFAREILYFMSKEVRSGIREDFMKSKFFGHGNCKDQEPACDPVHLILEAWACASEVLGYCAHYSSGPSRWKVQRKVQG